MKNLPWLALGFGLLLAVITVVANPLAPGTRESIPLLAILFMAELGVILCLVGVILSLRDQLAGQFSLQGVFTTVGNGLLLGYFANFGMNLWSAIN